jgi:hypothetical protein
MSLPLLVFSLTATMVSSAVTHLLPQRDNARAVADNVVELELDNKGLGMTMYVPPLPPTLRPPSTSPTSSPRLRLAWASHPLPLPPLPSTFVRWGDSPPHMKPRPLPPPPTSSQPLAPPPSPPFTTLPAPPPPPPQSLSTPTPAFSPPVPPSPIGIRDARELRGRRLTSYAVEICVVSGGSPTRFRSSQRDIYVEIHYASTEFATTSTDNNDRTPSWNSCYEAPFTILDSGSAYTDA